MCFYHEAKRDYEAKFMKSNIFCNSSVKSSTPVIKTNLISTKIDLPSLSRLI